MKIDKLQILIIGLVVAIIATLSVFAYSFFSGKNGKAALSVKVFYGDANVTIDEKDYGKAPVYTENIYAKDLTVSIDGNSRSYTTVIKPSADTEAVVNRDLGINDYFSSGQNIWFEKTGGPDSIISVISSSVKNVSVLVEGVEVGKTPVRFATKDLLSENDNNKYKIIFSKEGYDNQILNVVVKKGYTLNINIDMFLKPLPKEASDLDAFGTDGLVFLNFSGMSGAGFVDKQSWAKAINYWIKTRGEVKVSNRKIKKFNYFIDNDGKVYNELGNEIKPEEIEPKEGVFIAYLGSNDENTLSESAKTTIKKATGKEIVEGKSITVKGKVKIKDTGIGYLNIRSGSGTSNGKVGKVKVGETFDVLDKKNGWTQIEYEKGKKGWAIDKYLTTVTD